MVAVARGVTSIPDCELGDGLPAGIKIVAPPHREDLLIAAGLAVESWVDALPAPALRT